MNNKEHIERLKNLQITNTNEDTIFSNYERLRLWIDKVAPLLKCSNLEAINPVNFCIKEDLR